MTRHTESVEVVVKDQRPRRWPLEEKAALARRTSYSEDRQWRWSKFQPTNQQSRIDQ
jgi:hypothetical protein